MARPTGSILSATDSQWICTIGLVSQLSEYIVEGHVKGVLYPRFAFVGRSNVGKSTLLNALAERSLAQISKQPGKTRLLHFYNVPRLKLVLVDFPGYGYAKVERVKMDDWKKLINAYIEYDPLLKGVLLLWDARHGPTKQDTEAFNFFRASGRKIIIVMTKMDELKNQSERAKRKREIDTLLAERDIKPIWISAKQKQGIEDVESLLDSMAR